MSRSDYGADNNMNFGPNDDAYNGKHLASVELMQRTKKICYREGCNNEFPSVGNHHRHCRRCRNTYLKEEY